MSSAKERKANVKNILWGQFFIIISSILTQFFLSYYLKEKGLTIFQIGIIFTVGLAIGSLIISIVFAKIQKRIRLRSGLHITAFFGFISSLIMFIIPTALGAFIQQIAYRARSNIYSVSTDVAFQHNISGKEKNHVSSLNMINQGFTFLIGLGLSIIFIRTVGFKIAFGIFALLTIPAFLFFAKISENTRFKPDPKKKIPKTSTTLKILLGADIAYNFVLTASFVLIITFLVTDSLNGSLEWLAATFGILYLTMTITSILTKKYINNSNLLVITTIGMTLLLLSPILIITSTTLPVVFIALAIEGIGAGTWVPAQKALYWKLVKAPQRESLSGYYNGLVSFAKTLAPLAGGWLAVKYGILGPFYLKTIVAFAVIIVYISLLIKERNSRL